MLPGSLIFFSRMIAFFQRHHKGGAKRLQDVLNKYSRGSGQPVNKEKSTVLFNSNCDDAGCAFGDAN
jgi:hypothetical protein